MKRKQLVFLALFTFYLHSVIGAQSLTPQLSALLDHTLDSMLEVVGNKSLSAAIAYPGGQEWKRASGISSLIPLQNVNVDDTYLIGSITKTMTAACVLQLADEGTLTLDDSLHEWLPNYPFVDSSITIRHLLRHTSGLFDFLANPNCQPALLANTSYIWSADELLTQFMDDPLFAAGDGWSYSNTNYLLLGEIIKAATGNPFYTELRNRFFVPLSLNSIAIPSYEPLTSPVAHVWMDITGDQVTEDASSFYMSYLSLNSAAGPEGGYFATASDVSQWMRTYMRGDLLSPEMMAEMQTTYFAPGLPATTYGLGVMKRNFLGLTAYGHGGDLAYSGSSWYFPQRDISISVLNNDAAFVSWDLIPVVQALLRTIEDYNASVSVSALQLDPQSLVVFPNPFQDQLYIKVNGGIHSDRSNIRLISTTGQIVYQSSMSLADGNQLTHLKLSDGIPSGVYILEVWDEDKLLLYQKVLKS